MPQVYTLTVTPFINHLPSDDQTRLLEADFLGFLRQGFSSLDETGERVRRELYAAARAKLAGSRVLVEAQPNERNAGAAIQTAVAGLSKHLRQFEEPALKTERTYRDQSKRDGGKRRNTWWAGYNGVRFRASQEDIYPLEVMHRASAIHAQGFDRLRERLNASNRPTVERPELRDTRIEATLEKITSNATAHFEAHQQTTGFATLSSDGIDLGRVRCWSTNDTERDLSLEPHDRIKGGSVKRIPAPACLTSRSLRNGESRVVRFGFETVLGLGTHNGTLWLRGTADAEALLKVARKYRTTRAH